jgi:crotonobetainyl-CoA:carnitine CoA-transferase CaiB-like acyl-CoA transferase
MDGRDDAGPPPREGRLMEHDARHALGHVTVALFGGYAAGPAIGKYLANFGARVIHVESHQRPDGFREQYPPFKGDRPLDNNGCFAFFNDSQYGVTLNLKTPGGVAVARRLIRASDVVIENMRPGVMAKIGLGGAALRAEQPELVYLSTCNMGQTGPYATHPGFGSQLSSYSGFTELIGSPDGPPNFVYGPYIDLIAVAYGAVAILAALDRRRRTGEGACIDLSQYEAGLQFIAPVLLDQAANGHVACRAGNHDTVAVPHGCYPCRGEGWCTLSCWSDEEWARLAGVIGEPWASDTAWATADGRRAGQAALDRQVAAWTARHDARALMRRLQAAGVHAGVANTMKDLFEDPQVLARGLWQEQIHPVIGPQRYRMVSYQLSATPGAVRAPAPCMGQHNQAIFGEWLGITAEEYRELEAQGAFS